MAATTEAAPQTSSVAVQSQRGDFDKYYEDFKLGGAALGWGAATLVASAYAGIATTPGLIASNVHG